MSKLLLDIGNTRAKAAVYDNGEILERVATTSPSQLEIGRLCSLYGVDAAIASVVGTRPDFQSLLPASLLENFHQLTHNSRMPISIDYDTPQTLGMDRVAAAVGARQLCPDGALVVVDAGSCITIDLLDSDNRYRGGAILPGLLFRLRALHDYTAALPLVELSPGERNGDTATPMTGRSTRESIIAGVCNASLFEIEGFINAYKELCGDVKLFLTGGDAVFFAKQLFFPNFANSDMVFIGLNKILEMNTIH